MPLSKYRTESHQGASAICVKVVCKGFVSPASGGQSSGARETRALQNANMLEPHKSRMHPSQHLQLRDWRSVRATFLFIFVLIVFEALGAETDLRRPEFKKLDVHGVFGGRVVTAFLNDPKSFHPILTDDLESQIRNQMLHPGLVRINQLNQTPEPELARSWKVGENNLEWTFYLRRGLTWSDGMPFTAEDVLFTTQVVNGPEFPNAARDALTIDGKVTTWQIVDRYTIKARLPGVLSSFLRKMDGRTMPILARHKWEESFKSGKLIQALSVVVSPDDYATLGPFTLKEYKAGEYLRLKRNSRYWKIDAEDRTLPYLNEIVFLIIPDLNLLQLKIENGELDTFYSIRPQDVASMKDRGNSGVRLFNLGPSYGYEGLFLNQNSGFNPVTRKPYVDPKKLVWFRDAGFRKAISFAIDRESMVRIALYGMGLPSYGPESESNTYWYNKNIIKYPYDLVKARSLLKESGFVLRDSADGNSILYDAEGNQVRFTLYTNAGNTIRNQQCLIIAGDLAKLGIKVDYSVLEFRALIDKIINTYDYDAILLGKSHEVEPSDGIATWLSSSSSHFWWPKQQSPATDWERRIDELVRMHTSTFDLNSRKKYYDEIQYILSDQAPMIFTINELIWAFAKNKLGNLKPVIPQHRTLWNAEELYWNP